MMKFFILFIFHFSYFAYGQHQEKVDFIKASVYIRPEPLQRQLKGRVVYQFEVKQKVDSVFLDAKNMNFDKVELDGKQIEFVQTEKTITIKKKFKKGQSHKLNIEYVAKPKQTVYFIGWDDEIKGNEQIWTQGQGKYTSHWLPSFDDMEEKIEFDLVIEANNKYKVIANGKLDMQSNETEEYTVWLFNMEQPMSSYLLAFAIGDYDKQELISNSGVPIENYYYPVDSLKVEPTYRYTKEIFDFLETEIGVSYPWQNYKQVPVHDFLYAGMENTSATFFSDAYVIDSTSFMDRNYVNINAHELAHQWFGDLVTEKNSEHHWLHEGFATYYAYLAEKEVFRDDYFYWKLFDTAKVLNNASENGEGESLHDPKASSLTFYEKGAWALVMLREQIGETDFKTGIKNYLSKYQFKNATISDFITEMENASGRNLNDFENIWLNSTSFPNDQVKDFLMRHSHSIRMYYVLKHEGRNTFFTQHFLEDSELSTQLKLELLKRITDISPIEFLTLVSLDNLKLRQFVAGKIGIIPEELKDITALLLLDDSYITNELMLYNLWNSFDYDRVVYIDKTKGIIGLPNKNVRLLWLTLALVTPEYKPSEKPTYYEELVGYTASTYNPEVRQIAFQYLSEIKAFTGDAILNLVRATNHHSWQFRNFARELLDSLLQNDLKKKEIVNAVKQLNSSDLRYIKTKLDLP